MSERSLNQLRLQRASLRAALLLLLDQIDYTSGACTVTEMVGACLPKRVIEIARAVLEETKERAK